MTETEKVEILEGGSPGPAPRRVIVVVSVVLALGTGAAVVDHRIKASEAVQLTRCAEEVRDAIAIAENRVTAMAAYVRPTLSRARTERLRGGLLGLVSEAAADAEDRLSAAAVGCAHVDVLPTHLALRRQRADCTSALEDHLAHLRTVAGDGSKVFDAVSSRDLSC